MSRCYWCQYSLNEIGPEKYNELIEDRKRAIEEGKKKAKETRRKKKLLKEKHLELKASCLELNRSNFISLIKIGLKYSDLADHFNIPFMDMVRFVEDKNITYRKSKEIN